MSSESFSRHFHFGPVFHALRQGMRESRRVERNKPVPAKAKNRRFLHALALPETPAIDPCGIPKNAVGGLIPVYLSSPKG
jgi:hypothetical protein